MFEKKFAAGRVVASLLAMALVCAGVVGEQAASPAHALSGNDFVAGNVISDALFYDSQAMSQADWRSRSPPVPIGGRSAQHRLCG